jgi:hypothetical protein
MRKRGGEEKYEKKKKKKNVSHDELLWKLMN